MTLFRPQRGGLYESLNAAIPVFSRADIARHLGVSTEIGLKPYGYDDRIDWDTYLVTVNGEAVGFTNGPLA